MCKHNSTNIESTTETSISMINNENSISYVSHTGSYNESK